MPAEPRAQIPPADPAAPYDIVFLDRDGTINVRVEDGYVTRPEELVLLPGALGAIAALTRAGCRVVVVTNQRGVSRGFMSLADVDAVHDRLRARVAEAGGRIDAVLVCPHAAGTCECRKPAPGLFLRALSAAPWAEATRCAVVGDMPTDVAPGRELGMRTRLVGRDAPDLAGAVRALLDGLCESV